MGKGNAGLEKVVELIDSQARLVEDALEYLGFEDLMAMIRDSRLATSVLMAVTAMRAFSTIMDKALGPKHTLYLPGCNAGKPSHAAIG